MGSNPRHHPGHQPLTADLRITIILLVIVAVMISVVTIFSNLPGHGPVQSNYNSAAVGASQLFIILALLTTLDVLYYGATHWIGKEEGRGEYQK